MLGCLLAECALLRGFAFFASAAFLPVYMRSIHAAEIAQGSHGRAGFQQEMVAGDLGIAGHAKVAIRHPA
jgi:hypothetical protein